MKQFNNRIAIIITKAVGSMWTAYLFAIIALFGLAPALRPNGEGLVAWIAQTFLQLVLLSVIMVGQNITSIAAEQRSIETHDAVMEILTDVRSELEALKLK